MEMWQIWLLVKLDSIAMFLHFAAFMTCILAVFGTIAKCVHGMDGPDAVPKPIVKLINGVVVAACVLLPLSLGVPTTKEAAVIIAVPAIMESRVVKDDIPEVYDLAVQWAKDKLGKPANVEAP